MPGFFPQYLLMTWRAFGHIRQVSSRHLRIGHLPKSLAQLWACLLGVELGQFLVGVHGQQHVGGVSVDFILHIPFALAAWLLGCCRKSTSLDDRQGQHKTAPKHHQNPTCIPGGASCPEYWHHPGAPSPCCPGRSASLRRHRMVAPRSCELRVGYQSCRPRR